jgi:hypothetical protein
MNTLTATAFRILVDDLQARGNVLSDTHRAALLELVSTFSGYCQGTRQGRLAFPLPTGMGKTSAVVALIAALHRLGENIPVSVAASRVDALCCLKAELMDHGVPECLIGLKHTVPNACLDSTGNESRLFQLVTHARVRGGSDIDLVASHQGMRRPLVIYDETFMRADAFAFRVRGLFAAVAALSAEAEGDTHELAKALLRHLQEAAQRIREAVEQLQSEGDPHCNGRELKLSEIEPGTIKALQSLVDRYSPRLRGYGADLRDFLAISQDTLRIVNSEQGDGIVTAREVIPMSLDNVVILDASAPIRELARLDPTVKIVESFNPAELKSFENVEVRQLLSPGGRSTITESIRGTAKEVSAVAREVAGIISAGWKTEEAFLVFTFTSRGDLDMVGALRQDLQRLGVDIEAQTVDGRPRLRFLTWGGETSLNGLEYCTCVIMAGVLHRSHLDLSAMVRGQTGNLAEPTPSARVRELVSSEIAHCIYQGASRGSCRRIDQGKAAPMRLWFVHRDSGIRTILDRVMPGAVWTYPDPVHLKRARVEGKVARLFEQLLGHLQGLDQSTLTVASTRVKRAMGLGQDNAMRQAFTRACALLDLEAHGWVQKERSLVRPAGAYGFDTLATT